MGKLSENVDLINAKIERLKDMSPGSATSNEAGLYAENGEEIKKSARKLELCFLVELEKSAAEEEVKKAIAAAGKTLEELKGKVAGGEFFADDSFTKWSSASATWPSERTHKWSSAPASPMVCGRGRS